SSGSFGGAGGCAVAANELAGALFALISGGVTFSTLPDVGREGRTGPSDIFALPATSAGAFSLLSDALPADLAAALAAGSLPAPAAGTIDAILSFSTRTKPKSVFTRNMLSSYPTITP